MRRSEHIRILFGKTGMYSRTSHYSDFSKLGIINVLEQVPKKYWIHLAIYRAG